MSARVSRSSMVEWSLPERALGAAAARVWKRWAAAALCFTVHFGERREAHPGDSPRIRSSRAGRLTSIRLLTVTTFLAAQPVRQERVTACQDYLAGPGWIA